MDPQCVSELLTSTAMLSFFLSAYCSFCFCAMFFQLYNVVDSVGQVVGREMNAVHCLIFVLLYVFLLKTNIEALLYTHVYYIKF